MATINIIIQGIAKYKYTGGTLTIFEYAEGLSKKGHTVNLLPVSKSEYPEWYPASFNILHTKYKFHFKELVKSILHLDKGYRKRIVKELIMQVPKWGMYAFNRARDIEYLRDRMPDADITLATSYTTALPVYLYGTGKLFYFAQHYEPYFAIDKENAGYAEAEAKHSYLLGLNMISNSTWLKNMLLENHNIHSSLCLNAIDHNVFNSETPDAGSRKDGFTVLSYGGRNATWKGFLDAAEAIRIARNKIGDFEWRVYGGALLPPNNDIANYEDLGFIVGEELKNEYLNADIMLCSSWYESFPLFPIEAMACGAAVITTPSGTEDYAIHNETALLVEPKNSEMMANSIIQLYREPRLRCNLSKNAINMAQNFTWDRAVSCMESILLS